MKYNIYKYLFILGIVLVTSCVNSKMLTIEVLKPAPISFADNIVNVAIIDNAGAKLEKTTSQNQSKILISDTKDVFVESLGQFLNEENYFYEVKHYPSQYRTDTGYDTESPLTSFEIVQIAEKMDVDAIISIDFFDLYSSEVMVNNSGFLFRAAQANLNILLRIYDATGNNIAPMLVSSDSITWLGDQDLRYQSEIYKQLVLEISEGMVKKLVPHWEQQERHYYTGGNNAAKEALKYVTENNWTEAAKALETAFHESNKDKQKAQIASNISLAYEQLDDIDKAIEWIRIASNLIETYEYSNEKMYITWYKVRLLEREQTRDILLKQIAVEE